MNFLEALKNGTHKVFNTTHNSIELIALDSGEIVKCGPKSLSKLLWALKNKKIQDVFYRG